MTAAYGTVRQATAFAGVSTKTIRRQLRDGRLTPHRLGRRVLVEMAALDALIRRGASHETPDRPGNPAGASTTRSVAPGPPSSR